MLNCLVQSERQKDRKTERQKDRKTERQKDRKTERQKDIKTKGQKDRNFITWINIRTTPGLALMMTQRLDCSPLKSDFSFFSSKISFFGLLLASRPCNIQPKRKSVWYVTFG
jgi:hypothetical protein